MPTPHFDRWYPVRESQGQPTSSHSPRSDSPDPERDPDSTRDSSNPLLVAGEEESFESDRDRLREEEDPGSVRFPKRQFFRRSRSER